ncbi:putative proline-rich transmembrane protein 1-like [Scophthalmus maximus]|uniref:Putative proline-rich transmembrane protein 1-like n=1 Tax=Scophthalmus maximus TaxID=52904 RepID=A0A2U9AZF5_SCOMX|nr:putative proline-rich transmembrane protein 1-like [Scophthalmus maximus]
MDPYKSACAPALDYSGEKSSMGQMPPPAYLDNPYPGHPQPGPGHPQPGPGYSPHHQGYGGPPPYGGEGCGYQPYPMNQQYPAQPATVTVQPTVYLTQGPLAEPVKDYLCYSIFTMLCCCLPLGIAALIYSISAREANHVGDQMAAERSSRTSRTLNHVALGLGLGALILYIVIITMAAA